MLDDRDTTALDDDPAGSDFGRVLGELEGLPGA